MAKHTLKSCGLNTARFLKHVWPFFNIMKERVKSTIKLNISLMNLRSHINFNLIPQRSLHERFLSSSHDKILKGFGLGLPAGLYLTFKNLFSSLGNAGIIWVLEVNDVVLVFLLLTLNTLHTFF